MTDRAGPIDQAAKFVSALEALTNAERPDRQTLAQLRRGLDKPASFTLARAGWLFRDLPERKLDDAILVAGLFALANQKILQINDRNLGEAFGILESPERKERLESRFVNLLDADRLDLDYKLRQVIRLLSTKGIGFDWSLLLRHVGAWSHPNRWVQRQWGRGFWMPRTAANPSAPDGVALDN